MSGNVRDLHPDRIQDGRAVLSVLEGPDAGLAYTIEPHGEAEIGRDAGCAFRLSDPRVDPRHVRVRSNGREVILFRLGGPGSLFVGGESMEYRILAPGDEFQIGGTRIVVRAGSAGDDEASRRARTEVFLARAEENLPTAGGRSPGRWPSRPRFGEIALAQGLVDSATLARAVAFQDDARAAGRPVRLGEAMASQGALSAEHVDLVLQIQQELEALGEVQNYRYRRLLGAGSAGFVFEATSKVSGQTVALKIIRPELLSREEAVKRFLRESRILLDLDHPNLVRGLEVGFSNGLYFLAMEYVAGRSLRWRIESGGPVSETEALEILAQVVRALSAVEARGYLHRDIKPANILRAENGKAMLCDMGLAKSIGAKTSTSLTATGFIVGTPDYISPEQALGRDDIDIRSDIYSLGATLYHALVGNVPFYNRSPIEVMLKHVYEPIVPPRAVRPEISARTSALIVKMMAKEPKDRFPGTAALLKALG